MSEWIHNSLSTIILSWINSVRLGLNKSIHSCARTVHTNAFLIDHKHTLAIEQLESTYLKHNVKGSERGLSKCLKRSNNFSNLQLIIVLYGIWNYNMITLITAVFRHFETFCAFNILDWRMATIKFSLNHWKWRAKYSFNVEYISFVIIWWKNSSKRFF